MDDEQSEIERLKGDGQYSIAFNVKLVLDVIKVLDSDDVTFHFNDELSPCRVESVGDDSYMYIIEEFFLREYWM